MFDETFEDSERMTNRDQSLPEGVISRGVVT